MMIDMNGDGLPDRLMARQYSGLNFTNYLVQFNTGSNFTRADVFGFAAYDEPAAPGVYGGALNSEWVRMIDINGDGLPDRVMYPLDPGTGAPEPDCSAVPAYEVEYNNGYGFEPIIAFGGIQGLYTNCFGTAYSCDAPSGSAGASLQDEAGFALRDINGDGLPDRIIRYDGCNGATNWLVQVNLGTNFSAPVSYGPYSSQGQPGDKDF